MTKQDIIAALYLAAGCLQDSTRPMSHVGRFIWPSGGMSANILESSRATEITIEIAQLADAVIKELWIDKKDS